MSGTDFDCWYSIFADVIICMRQWGQCYDDDDITEDLTLLMKCPLSHRVIMSSMSKCSVANTKDDR